MPTAAPQRAEARRQQAPARAPARLEALDALRGLAIALMVFVNNPGDVDAMPSQFVHSEWHGYRVAELVFPMFLVSAGAAMALSRRSGAARAMLRRSALLVVIGCVLVSVKYRHPAPSTGTLQLIAGAALLAWAARRWLSRRAQMAAAVLVQGGLWAGFTITGWAEGTNLAARVDTAVLGSPSDLGLLGIVSAATLVLAGAWLGDAIRDRTTPARRAAVTARAGAVALAAGLALATLVPLNKRLWTPSYVIVSFGVSCLVLAGLLWWCGRRWTDSGLGPLKTLGSNAIVVYVVTSLAATTVLEPVQDRFMPAVAATIAPAAASLAWASAVLLLGYAVSRALERRRLLVRL